MVDWISWIPGLFLGAALSAGSGFRIFIPMLVSNIAARAGWVSLSENMAWMGSETATWVFLAATVFEIVAFYIPFIDNLLDSIAVPSSVIAGTLLTGQFLNIQDPVFQWGLGLMAGGGVAGTVQAGTSLLRLVSTKFTAGIGNSIFSTVENIVSTIFSVLAILIPMLMGILAFILVFWIIRKFRKRKVKRAEDIS